MEKGLYKFETLPEIQHFFPDLSQEAQNRLCDSIIDNDCTIPIFVWKKDNVHIIVDGHYRYKICHELGIPFEYEELEFDSIESVKVWRLDMHITTKQLSDFQKCELAFPLEKAISEMVERRRRDAISKARQTGLQISRSKLSNEVETGLQISQSMRTSDYMAQRLGLTRSKWDMAKFLVKNADEDLKIQLRSGKAKITPEYRKLVALIKPKVVEELEVQVVQTTDENWLPRACSTDSDKTKEPPIEHIGGFKPVTHQEESFEFFPHEPERNPGPFYYVKDYTRSALKNMIKEIKTAVYQLSDEDADKGSEILSMLDEAYNTVRGIIEKEIKFHSSRKKGQKAKA